MSVDLDSLALPPGERQQLLAEVSNVDQNVEEARGKADYQKLLVQLERGLSLRRRLYTENSPEVLQACKSLCEACNLVATNWLQQDNAKGALDLLKRAEEVAEKSDADRAITWNNLACYYRRIGKHRAAVKYLESALKIEEDSGRMAETAQTHLNLCATLSQLRRHGEALAHAQTALIHIYEVLAPLMLRGELRGCADAENSASSGVGPNEQVTVLCIAYHNVAAEYEYLQKFDSAICAYAQGYFWATTFLNEGHQLIGLLHDAVQALKAKLPPESRAVEHAAELMAGGGALSPPRAAASGDLDLLTPRNAIPGDGGEMDSDSPQ